MDWSHSRGKFQRTPLEERGPRPPCCLSQTPEVPLWATLTPVLAVASLLLPTEAEHVGIHLGLMPWSRGASAGHKTLDFILLPPT